MLGVSVMTNNIQNLNSILDTINSSNKLLSFAAPIAKALVEPVEAKQIAVLENKTVVIALEHKFLGAVLSSQVVLNKIGIMFDKPLYLPKDEVAKIYDYAVQNELVKTFVKQDLSFGSEEKNLSSQEVEELFAKSTILSSYLRASYTHDKNLDWIRDVEARDFSLQKKGKYLEFVGSKIKISSPSFAVFDNGDLYYNRYLGNRIESLISNLHLKKIEVKKQIFVSLETVEEIYLYAQKLYKDRLVEKTILSPNEFVAQIFAEEGKCLTSQTSSKILPEIRGKFVVLLGGRILVADNLLHAQKRAISAYIREDVPEFKKMFFFADENVPQSYIDEVYAQVESNIFDMAEKNIISEASSHDEAIKFFANGAKCLSLADTLLRVEDRHKLAVFSNGVVVVSKGEEKSYELYEMQKKYKELNLQEPLVANPSCVLAIYEIAAQKQKTFRDIVIEKLKKLAKKLSDKKNMSHTDALEDVAKNYGYASWKKLTQISEDYACHLLKDIDAEEKTGFLLLI